MDDALRRTPLHFAAEARNHAEVANLLVAGADVNATDYRASTPLHVAASVGAADVVALLLGAGADPQARTAFEETPLHRLAAGGGLAPAAARLAIVDRLLTAGCPIDAVDSVNRTALWYAAATGTAEPAVEELTARYLVLERLLERGADPTIAAAGTQGRPSDAAKGLHQSRKYRRIWPEAVALLDGAGPPR
jgi:ankyrin repeat protein